VIAGPILQDGASRGRRHQKSRGLRMSVIFLSGGDCLRKLEFSVHEFMAVMDHLNAGLDGGKAPKDSVYNEWHDQWKALDERLEALAPMQRADMLFDGKVTINAIGEPHLREVIGVVEDLIAMQKKLMAEGDEDADPEDLEVFETRLNELKELLNSDNWLRA
jgi:hypothetical protein